MTLYKGSPEQLALQSKLKNSKEAHAQVPMVTPIYTDKVKVLQVKTNSKQTNKKTDKKEIFNPRYNLGKSKHYKRFVKASI